MKIDKKIFFSAIFALATAIFCGVAEAQIKPKDDTIACPIIGFGVGLNAPLPGWSMATAEDGSTSTQGTMADLYSAPYLDFGVLAAYKFKSNWLATLEGDLWFGASSDNLTHRTERMGDVYTPEDIVISFGGYDGVVTCYNRGIAVRAGGGRFFPVIKSNHNSGIMARMSGGWFSQRTVFSQDRNETPVPQLSDRYRRLYDHYRNGVILTEAVGFLFMSNNLNLVNFSAEITLSECLSWSSRNYMLDNRLGLNGKDGNTYFDLMLGVKFTWMFPLRGRTAYEYYFY
ncbi:MAG: hypothetical protein IJ789_03215 [Bacteroidales bacterium]|nr:hypothetical protein [Bacteroidales bacterium]